MPLAHTKQLQRSRTRWSAERNSMASTVQNKGWLQRSRTRWSAERMPVISGTMPPLLLQRSRTRWSAERSAASSKTAPVSPLQRSRTRWSAESFLPLPSATSTHQCFNGAALVGVRRVLLDNLNGLHVALLQRSRTRWSAESSSIPSIALPRERASTEPHSLECGEPPSGFQLGAGWLASTEPHSLECGERW